MTLGLLPRQYDIDQEITISATFTRPADGVLVDPDDVILYVGAPGGVVSTFKFSLSQVIKDQAGKYHMDLLLNASGWWSYKWQGTGLVPATCPDERFFVRDSFAIAG